MQLFLIRDLSFRYLQIYTNRKNLRNILSIYFYKGQIKLTNVIYILYNAFLQLFIILNQT